MKVAWLQLVGLAQLRRSRLLEWSQAVAKKKFPSQESDCVSN